MGSNDEERSDGGRRQGVQVGDAVVLGHVAPVGAGIPGIVLDYGARELRLGPVDLPDAGTDGAYYEVHGRRSVVRSAVKRSSPGGRWPARARR